MFRSEQPAFGTPPHVSKWQMFGPLPERIHLIWGDLGQILYNEVKLLLKITKFDRNMKKNND
jgi:hypothetical protein